MHSNGHRVGCRLAPETTVILEVDLKKLFSFVAVLRRTILDNMRFTVRADTVEEAKDKAKAFLKNFPDPHSVEGIDYAYIDNREHLDSEILDFDIDKGK